MGTLASSISSGEKKEDKCGTQTKGDSKMNNQTLRTKTIVCEEVFHENSVPSEGEVLDYAKKIGIDPEREPHLLPIALNGLMQPLPQGWRPCFDGTLKRWYYYNDITKSSQWEHPLDDVYRNLVKRGRSEGYCLMANDEVKIPKEDIKSFEDISEHSSGKENKLDNSVMDLNGTDKVKDSYPRTHQPLLLRRKQLQLNVNSQQFPSLHVAKLISKTRKDDIEERGESKVCRMAICKLENSPPHYASLLSKENNKTFQPHRRVKTPVHTLAPQNLSDTQIKGAIFSSGPKKLTRSSPIQDMSNPSDSPKKKLVKFTDLGRKSEGTKYKLSDNESSLSEEEFAFEEKKENSNYHAEKLIENSGVKMIKKSIIPDGGNKFGSAKNTVTKHGVNCMLDEESEGKIEDVRKQRLSKMSPSVHSPLKNSIKEETTKGDLSASDTNMMNISTSLSSNSTSKKQLDPEIADLRDAIKNMVNFDNTKLDLASYVKNKSSTKLAMFEEKLAKEIQEKLTQLKMQQIERMNKFKYELEKQEESEKGKLQKEIDNNLENLKISLNIERELKEKEIRNEHEKAMGELIGRLEAEKANHIASKMIEYKAEEDQQITDIKNRGLLRIEEVKTFFETQAKEMEEKYQSEVKKLDSEFTDKLNNLKIAKEGELKEAEAEWQEKIKANSIQHELLFESTTAEHKKNMDALQEKFQKEEQALKQSNAEHNNAQGQSKKEPNTLILTMEFEKVKCEKRIIEDKFKMLKEKYLHLKKEIENAVERKLKNKSRKKKEEQNLGKELKAYQEEKEKRNDEKENNDENQLSLPKTPTKPGTQNEPSSDDQYTSLSLTLPNIEHISHSTKMNKVERKKVKLLEKKKLSRGKLRLEHSRNRPSSILCKMSHQEEKAPANSQGDTYIHYTFQGQGCSTKTENDSYIQKIIQEQEAVRNAREYLLQQKREIDARYNIIRNNTSTMQELQQQDRDLTEMEASLYRTKALLGEKMVHLRLLGQTFTRIIQDTPNSLVKANIQMDNSLITTINTLPAVADLVGTDKPYVNFSITKPEQPIQRIAPRSEIESKLKDMQNWLEKTAPK
ncbi:centrosomal protein of 164 kDa-like isoform X1 [Cimex lectularius]|uniref:WW domain-containing protein n=1 Tax=Cimex lectularius TaxID=79782 RepID=A0A8I6SA77_CIMLE|nr:centrosomal protein of 164 kDa-like isoform X1 [Cimex lectularius]